MSETRINGKSIMAGLASYGLNFHVVSKGSLEYTGSLTILYAHKHAAEIRFYALPRPLLSHGIFPPWGQHLDPQRITHATPLPSTSHTWDVTSLQTWSLPTCCRLRLHPIWLHHVPYHSVLYVSYRLSFPWALWWQGWYPFYLMMFLQHLDQCLPIVRVYFISI